MAEQAVRRRKGSSSSDPSDDAEHEASLATPSGTLTQPFKLFGIEFAPISIPLERRLQTFGVAFILYVFFLGAMTSMTVLAYLYFYTKFSWITLGYVAWYFYDIHTCHRGGRKWTWFRNWFVFRHAAQYFPVSLVKTKDIPADQTYLFCYHPHGILSFGGFLSFGTEALNFSKLFPGLECRLLTLRQNFWMPGGREFTYGLGMCSSTKESMVNLLSRPRGMAATLVVGGALEALNYSPEEIKLVLNRRKGFVKLALRFGRPLVPVFGFGEAFTYEQTSYPEGSKMRIFQDWFERQFAFSTPLFNGRGIFNYTFGYMPFRRPINVVVGEPMAVERIEEPTSDDIERTHARYVEQLKALYEKYNPIYGDPKVRLVVS